MPRRLISFVVLFVLLGAPVLAEPISVTISQTSAFSNTQRLTSDYLKKLLEERSLGRLQVTLSMADFRSSGSLMQALVQQRSQLVLVDLAERTRKLSQQQLRDLTLSNHIPSNRILIVSRSFWDSLPEDLKVIVKGAIEDATLYYRELAQQEERQSLKKPENGSLKIHRLTPAQRMSWQTERQKVYPQLNG